MCDPRTPPGSQTAIDSLEHQVRDLGARALKCYTGNGSWWLDDEDVSYPMLEEASRLGLRLINVHKGFPQLLGNMAEEYVQSRDLPKVSRDWPRLNFVAYHSGYFPGPGITEFLGVMRTLRRRRVPIINVITATVGMSLHSPRQRRQNPGPRARALVERGEVVLLGRLLPRRHQHAVVARHGGIALGVLR
jgi:predicted TIM-barrel fold metal-dependent hydrolase